jgi:hypothetical protein
MERRTRFMAEANRAYQFGDAEALQRILSEYQESADAVDGEGIAAELIRTIRQISVARDRVAAGQDPQISSIPVLSPSLSIWIPDLSITLNSMFDIGVRSGYFKCRPPCSLPDPPPISSRGSGK